MHRHQERGRELEPAELLTGLLYLVTLLIFVAIPGGCV
jgi:hypothetical protein